MIREWFRSLIFETMLEVLYYTGLVVEKQFYRGQKGGNDEANHD